MQAVGLDQHDSAFSYEQQAKELLHVLESEAGYLAMLCYNLGLDVFHRTDYQNSVTWLKLEHAYIHTYIHTYLYIQ